MAPTRHQVNASVGLERVRAQILVSLHLGRLKPGERAPSVRRLADVTGLNRNVVHRAYRRLAEEGLLRSRRGSGTFVAERSGTPAGRPSARSLLAAVSQFRAEAQALGLPTDVYAKFLHAYVAEGFHRVPLAVVECNLEQLELIQRDVGRALGVSTRPVLLSLLVERPHPILDDSRGVVTTDCHWAEVAEIATRIGVPVYRVALDPSFPQSLVEHARKGPLIMIVRDPGFAPAFRRLLAQMSVPAEVVRRFRIVTPREALEHLAELNGSASVYVSPTVEREMSGRIPPGVRRLDLRWRVAPSAMEQLRADLALDLAYHRQEH
jgi:DNA-binding transcriptional regulator YhcF (GntR family)